MCTKSFSPNGIIWKHHKFRKKGNSSVVAPVAMLTLGQDLVAFYDALFDDLGGW
jgi:hypothetical protein